MATEDRVPVDLLAQLDYDKSAAFFAIVPLVIMGVLAVAIGGVYLYRRGRTWNELGESMRLDDDPASTHPDGVQSPTDKPKKP